MVALVQQLLSLWATILHVEDAVGFLIAGSAPALACVGLLLTFWGIKLYRPALAVLVFFVFTGLIGYYAEPRVASIFATGSVAVVGVFLAFMALFVKRPSIWILSACFAGATAWLLLGGWVATLIVAIVVLTLAMFFPRAVYIVTSALFGGSLLSSAAVGSWALLSGGAVLVPPALAGIAGLALMVCGIVVQTIAARKGLSPVFNQTIRLDALHVPEDGLADGVAVDVPVDAPPRILYPEVAGSDERDELPEEDRLAREGTSAAAGFALMAGSAAALERERAAITAQIDAGDDVDAERVAPLETFVRAYEPYDPTFRHEVKYLVNALQFEVVKPSLDAVLDYDAYSGSAGYQIRSLYFDSLDDRDLYDKLDGTQEHKKIRLRTYDPAGDRFALEFKCRWGEEGFKRKLSLDRAQAERLVRGDLEVLRDFPQSELAQILYERMVRGCYTPAVIVDYHRLAYVYPTSDIRITLDTGLSAGYDPWEFFSLRPAYVPIQAFHEGVLEVKYNVFFPSPIKEILGVLEESPASNSKYELCRRYR